MSVIECNALTKIYSGINVLDHISCQIEENKITGLIGRNGAGKTTLLKIIAGFLRHSSGEVKVFQEQPFNSLFVSANMIFIDDQMSLPAALTLREILEEASRFYKHWDMGIAERLFDYFSLNPKQHHGNLSKGMKSTFNMILGLSARCPLTIFDEPTTGMDASVRKDFYRALLKDYLAYPRTVIISSHHLDEIEHLLEDVLVLNKGRVQLHRSISDLKEWAIGLQGEKELIEKWALNHELIYMEPIDDNRSYAVVRHDFTSGELNKMRRSGLDVLPVRVSDLCMYLTDGRQGGIDDVFFENDVR